MAVLVELDDPDDPRLADYRDLRDVELRKHLETEHGLFLAEGEKVVRRAVAAGFAPRSFLMAPRWLEGLSTELAATDVPCYVLPEELIEQVTGFHVHRGALASLERRPLPSVEAVLTTARADRAGPPAATPLRIAVLEDLVDHANVGAAFRNAAALGFDAVLLSPRCADPLYRRAIKVSMGAVLQMPWTRFVDWPGGVRTLRDAGITVAGLTLAEDSISLDELAEATAGTDLAVVLGTEGDGIRVATTRLLDYRVRIPMARGVDSLNVSAAAAIAFYTLR